MKDGDTNVRQWRKLMVFLAVLEVTRPTDRSDTVQLVSEQGLPGRMN